MTRALLTAGVLHPSDVLDGQLLLRDVSRRNRNTVITRPDGTGVFVKREGRAGPGTEQGRYSALARVPGLSEIMPAVVRGDLPGILVLGVEPGAIDLHEHQRAGGPVGAEIGRAVGGALALLHRGTRGSVTGPTIDGIPEIFGIHRPDVACLRTLSPATVDLIRTIQRHDTLCANLDAAREGWRNEAVIHGDVKWPNILVVPSSSNGLPIIRLVDWEHSGEGDPAWDVGSAVAGYLSCWIASMPASQPGDTTHEHVVAARAPLSGLRPSIAAMWDEYTDGAAIAPDARGAFRQRAVVLCAVRLIRTAFEESESRERMSEGTVRHLQVAANILDNPKDAAVRLLGLGA